MSTLAKQIRERAHGYVRKGSKDNRRRQVQRLVLFVDWVESQEAVGDLGRLGKRHVIRFWEAHRELSNKTRYGYWLAFCTLWDWLDKPDKPPRPFKIERPLTQKTEKTANTLLAEFRRSG